MSSEYFIVYIPKVKRAPVTLRKLDCLQRRWLRQDGHLLTQSHRETNGTTAQVQLLLLKVTRVFLVNHVKGEWQRKVLLMTLKTRHTSVTETMCTR